MKIGKQASVALGLGLALLGALGCGSRPAEFDAPFIPVGNAVGLDAAVAVKDVGLSRLLFLSATADGGLDVDAEPLGQGISEILRSPSGEDLLVLSRGVVPRVNSEDEPPRLVVLSGQASTQGRLKKSFELDDPKNKLAVDPLGEWVLAFQGDATVTNLNELVLCDLSGKAVEGKPISKTIRSFGGAPVAVSFSQELNVPQGAPRRFLAVRTDRDIALLDLSDLSEDEITIPLPESGTGGPLAPAEVIFDDGDPDDPNDARLAIRLANSSDVVLVQLAPPADTSHDYSIVMNIVDVGGVPSAIDFVHTDGGLRLAALVPSRQRATLVNPETTKVEVVDLPRAFTSMRRVTADVDGSASEGDVALLWGSSSSIAFWTLGTSSNTPYRSIDLTELAFAVGEVLDVPAPNQHLKVLRSEASSQLYILDLKARQSFPFTTAFAPPRVEVSSDGERLWVYQAGSSAFSSIRLTDLHPKQLTLTPSVGQVFDVRTKGGRSAIVLHEGSGLNVSVLSAENPDPTKTKFFPALHLGGL